MKASSAIKSYNKVGLESGVFGADPHGLISMLFEGALIQIANATNEIQRKETAAKGKSISRAISIIGEGLDASLDKEVGGELAQSLSSLYYYMAVRLVEANLKNDIAILDEVARLLTELKGAWDGIRPKVMNTAPRTGATANPKRVRATA